MSSANRRLSVGAVLFALSQDAVAASVKTVEELLLIILAVGAGFWLAFAFIGPFRRTLLRIPRNATRGTLFVFAAVALLYAVGSIALGKTWMGADVVLRAVDPNWFWLLVKFEAGVGFALLVLALLTPRQSK